MIPRTEGISVHDFCRKFGAELDGGEWPMVAALAAPRKETSYCCGGGGA